MSTSKFTLLLLRSAQYINTFYIIQFFPSLLCSEMRFNNCHRYLFVSRTLYITALDFVPYTNSKRLRTKIQIQTQTQTNTNATPSLIVCMCIGVHVCTTALCCVSQFCGPQHNNIIVLSAVIAASDRFRHHCGRISSDHDPINDDTIIMLAESFSLVLDVDQYGSLGKKPLALCLLQFVFCRVLQKK